ncbi:HupE/UreJ family protein [Photobacterium makurazakiensis]|uniref:HupE/UreJ family protein n=1 Tax=Photobacterium makurazakiensis TaxID=2910234 RepID=UPI003D1072A8
MKLLLLILSLTSSFAFAHSAESTAGFIDGVIHPLSGWLHLFAMLAVGVLSSRFGGSTIWQVPAVFIASMLFGLYLGERGFELPYFELAIAVSLILLGGLLALKRMPPLYMMVSFVLFFGVFHGYAHGIEIGGLINPTGFRKGFFLGSVLIHIIGVMFGMVPKQYRNYHKVVNASGYGYITLGIFSVLVGSI